MGSILHFSLCLFLSISAVCAQRTSSGGTLTDLCLSKDEIISSVSERDPNVIDEGGGSTLITYETALWKVSCSISGETNKCFSVFQTPKSNTVKSILIDSILNKEAKIIQEGKEWVFENNDCPARVTLVYNEKNGKEFFVFESMNN